jgi:polyisoprenoid-binding protein YceI
MKSLLFIVLFTTVSALLIIGNWKADASKAKITFTVGGPFGDVHGSFSGLKSSFQFNENDLPGSSLTASIDPNTVNSGVGLRNTHLRNEEQFLNTAKYPLISFKSNKFEKTGDGFLVSGDLTLKATTKPIEIPFTFSSTGNTGLFKGHFSIKREDYLIGNSGGGTVGDVITIGIEVPVTK